MVRVDRRVLLVGRAVSDRGGGVIDNDRVRRIVRALLRGRPRVAPKRP